MQIKTTIRYLLTPVRMVIIKKKRERRNVGKDIIKRTLIQYWWECKIVNHYGQQHARSSKN
jgi:hypothetical protein